MTVSRTLTWVEATEGDPRHERLWRFLAEQVEVLVAGRLRTRVVHAPFAAGGIRTPANRLLSDAGVLAAALADAGADVIVLGCWGAPTVAVRTAVPGVVSSLPDGSVRAVGSLARRAVVVTVAPSLVPIFTDDLVGSGASGFLADRPVRAYEPESTLDEVVAAIDSPDALIARFDAAAREAVADGADAIVVGCGYLAPIFTAHGYTSVGGHPEVPVLDCNRLAVEHALQLLALADAGIEPTARGYVRPRGLRAEALAAASARLTTEPFSTSESELT